jgi:predicted RNase H-like HicB family nuclease
LANRLAYDSSLQESTAVDLGTKDWHAADLLHDDTRHIWYDADTLEGADVMKGITIELIPDPELGGFTARIPDIPAYGEGETEEEAIADLKEAVRGYIETFGLEDALARVSRPAIRQLDWDLTELARG